MRSFYRLALLLGAMLAANPAGAHTLDELVAKNTFAKGGIAALRGIQSLRQSGKMLVNNDQIELGYVEIRKRPGLVRAEANLQGLTAVQAWDGKQAWQIQPFQGRKDPEQQPQDDAKDLIEDADFEGPLLDSAAKHYKLEYLGTEDVDGTLAHKIQVTKPDGDVLYVYLDPDHFLEIRIVARHLVRGAPKETVSDFGDYEKVNGVYFPFSIISGDKSSSDRQKIQYDKAEVNTVGDDTQFHFPAATAKK